MAHRTSGLLPPKVITQTRPLKGHAMPMVLACVSQILREVMDDPLYEDTITQSIDEILRDFVKPEKRCLLETVLADGSILDTPEGRTVNPGHAIETSWFMMEEARRRADSNLLSRACEILEWSLDAGWDAEHGGLLYFVDRDGKQPEPYEHELKLWWPHTEAMYACLLAFHLTHDPRWSEWYDRVHEWAFSHFADGEYGEWFGYLRRNGAVCSTVKGNMWKGPFHLLRKQLYAWKLLEEATQGGS